MIKKKSLQVCDLWECSKSKLIVGAKSVIKRDNCVPWSVKDVWIAVIIIWAAPITVLQPRLVVVHT